MSGTPYIPGSSMMCVLTPAYVLFIPGKEDAAAAGSLILARKRSLETGEVIRQREGGRWPEEWTKPGLVGTWQTEPPSDLGSVPK